MKPKDKILTYDQAREIKWFCKNVIGTRQEYYAVMDKANAFDEKLKRLEKTCELIEKFFGPELKKYEDYWAKLQTEVATESKPPEKGGE